MRKILLNNTNILVSRISFGTSSLHHLISKKDRQNILSNAGYHGISHFDTSPYYGYGLAESDLGEFIKKERYNYTIATKIGLYPYLYSSKYSIDVWTRIALGKLFPIISLPKVNQSLKLAKKSLNNSLKNLKSDYVDFLFLHEPFYELYNTDEYLKWLDEIQANGKIRFYGIAGTQEKIIPFLLENCNLSKIIQTKDSVDKNECSFLSTYNRELQFTYGYFSSKIKNESFNNIISKSLEKNKFGSLIYSTKNIIHQNHFFDFTKNILH